ncbi:MAG: helix-turn-helix transcriptional regulator [Microgenomates group bacterium]|nr:helix-turn-helix transcriptional regulator [Candidatus Woesebacteria bacterium]MBP6883169.1 helix-turn-helix transcriptional regulator [Candidatus Woesebacteria bacterium]QQR63689.1 MAG: helix-turn-helix transcriptional regulator [Candidatus Roizmanbacteria bacterium]
MKGNFFYKRLGEKICRARRRRFLSQEKLAFLSDVDRTYVARIEVGKVNPSIRVVHKIARALRVRINRLIS